MIEGFRIKIGTERPITGSTTMGDGAAFPMK